MTTPGGLVVRAMEQMTRSDRLEPLVALLRASVSSLGPELLDLSERWEAVVRREVEFE